MLEENLPYGLNTTKRLVVPTAEVILFKKYETEDHKSGSVELVDYMGGDDMAVRVATAGHGTDIFPENPSKSQLLLHCKSRGIIEPFKWIQFKFRIQSSITDALHIVYEPTASVNEYSARYSVMLDTAFGPSVEYLKARMEGKDKMGALDRAKRAHERIKETRQANFARYSHLVGKEVDLARELARAPQEIDNDTKFYWKIDLVSLIDFIKRKRALLEDNPTTLMSYLDEFEDIAAMVAPEAVDALTNNGWKTQLTYPKFDEVVDSTPLPAQWRASETKRICVPALEEMLFVRKPYLEHGAVQAVDYMGDEQSPAEAARVSYGEGTKRLMGDRKLVKTLYRGRHTTPLEQLELAIETLAPGFVEPRQASRHRTIDSHGFMGETLFGSKQFIPRREEQKFQDRKNRQGRGKELDEELKDDVIKSLRQTFTTQTELIKELRELGIDERTIQGRRGIGHFNFRSRTGDLHNWLHFLGLRLDPHAQKEIQEYAQPIAELVKRHAPPLFEAFMDYKMNAVTFTASDKPLIVALASQLGTIDLEDVELYKPLGFVTPSKKKGKDVLTREGIELRNKLRGLVELAKSPDLKEKIDAIHSALDRDL